MTSTPASRRPSGASTSRSTSASVCSDTSGLSSARASAAVSASNLPERASGKASHGVAARASQRSMSTASGSVNGLSPTAFSRSRTRAMAGSSGTGGNG